MLLKIDKLSPLYALLPSVSADLTGPSCSLSPVPYTVAEGAELTSGLRRVGRRHDGEHYGL